MGDTPAANPIQEAIRITNAANAADVACRITGGVAIAMRCPSATAPELNRPYADIDGVGRARQRKELSRLLAELGYEPDSAFNALHGETRLFFWDGVNGRQLDIFLDRVEMCHNIDLSDRLDVHGQTLSLADLLLMKLQVVETNRKDLLDLVTLLVDHAFTSDESGINLDYLTGLTARDWGLWRTTTMTAERTDQFARELEGFARQAEVHAQVSQFLAALESVPKTRSWKLRARIGERARWYELPEESH